MFVKPWDKSSMDVLRQLSISGRAYVKNPKINRIFGHKCKELIDNGLLDIASTRYAKREDKQIFVTPINVSVIPKPSRNGINFHFRRFKIL